MKALLLIAALFGYVKTDHLEIVSVMDQEPAKHYLEVACEFTGGLCPAAPEVLFTPTRVGLLGFHFRGTSYVFITDRCLYREYEDRMKCKAVIVHEMVHYIVSEQGRYVDDSCGNEQLAWGAFNQYVIRNDRSDLVNLDWRKAYPECQSN